MCDINIIVLLGLCVAFIHGTHSPSAYSPVMPYVLLNPLIVMLGVSNYDATFLPSLKGVYNDYCCVQNVFNCIRGHSIVYLNENDELIYVNKIIDTKVNNSSNKFKLKWTVDDIDMFNVEIKEKIVNGSNEHNHDGLIYIISAHGNRDEYIYDSNGEQYNLSSIYKEYDNENCKPLRDKPKLFIIDNDRIVQRKHRASLTQSVPTLKLFEPSDGDDNVLSNVDNNNDNDTNNNSKDNPANMNSLMPLKLVANKTFTKEEHLRKIFCKKDSKINVVNGGKNINGGYLIQSMAKAFSNDKLFYNETFCEILREMRIIAAQLMGIPNQSALIAIHDKNSLPFKLIFKNSDEIKENIDDEKEQQEYLSQFESNVNVNGKKATKKKSIDQQVYTICKPLIVFLGISKYNRASDLHGIPIDFENIIKTLNHQRGYTVAYYNNKKKLQLIQGNSKSVSQHVKNLRLQWNESDIFSFNSMVYKHICSSGNSDNGDDILDKYDSLMYFISCHGGSGGVICDSDGEKLPLVTIFDQFNNKKCVHLRNKPKIYWIAACRGSIRAKRFVNSNFVLHGVGNRVNPDRPVASENDSVTTGTSSNNTINICDNNEQTITNSEEKHNSNQTDMDVDIDNDVDDETKSQEKKDYNLHLFSKFNWNRVIYANTEGYVAMEHRIKGDYMIRSMTKAFINDDIFKCDFDQIIVQMRKILVKLMGTSRFSSAQVIDDQNDIPCNVFFKTKKDLISK